MSQESMGFVQLKASDLERLLYGRQPQESTIISGAVEIVEHSEEISETELESFLEKVLKSLSLEELYDLQDSAYTNEQGEKIVDLKLDLQRSRLFVSPGEEEYLLAISNLEAFNEGVIRDIGTTNEEIEVLQSNFDALLFSTPQSGEKA